MKYSPEQITESPYLSAVEPILGKSLDEGVLALVASQLGELYATMSRLHEEKRREHDMRFWDVYSYGMVSDAVDEVLKSIPSGGANNTLIKLVREKFMDLEFGVGNDKSKVVSKKSQISV